MTWGEFARLEPAMSAAGRELFYAFGVGLAFLGTVRADGGPRLHPMCPLLWEDGLYAFIVPSPKRSDLHRDGRYAMHSFPMESNEDAFYLTGTASYVEDRAVRAVLAGQFATERSALEVPEPSEHEHLFSFALEGAMLTRTTGHGDPAPQHTIWRAPTTVRSA